MWHCFLVIPFAAKCHLLASTSSIFTPSVLKAQFSFFCCHFLPFLHHISSPLCHLLLVLLALCETAQCSQSMSDIELWTPASGATESKVLIKLFMRWSKKTDTSFVIPPLFWSSPPFFFPDFLTLFWLIYCVWWTREPKNNWPDLKIETWVTCLCMRGDGVRHGERADSGSATFHHVFSFKEMHRTHRVLDCAWFNIL